MKQEIFAILRRFSTHTDGRVSLEEFASFLGSPLSEADRVTNREKMPAYMMDHRATEFESLSRLNANIERDIKTLYYPHLKSTYQASPALTESMNQPKQPP